MRRFRGRALSDRPGGPADPGGSPHDGKPSADVCDSCSVKLDRAQGYYLATARIVMSESFWQSQFARVRGIVDTFDWDEHTDLRKFDGMLRYVAGSATPWLICENCSELFLFDRTRRDRMPFVLPTRPIPARWSRANAPPRPLRVGSTCSAAGPLPCSSPKLPTPATCARKTSTEGSSPAPWAQRSWIASAPSASSRGPRCPRPVPTEPGSCAGCA
jgi:hypothetical protein